MRSFTGDSRGCIDKLLIAATRSMHVTVAGAPPPRRGPAAPAELPEAHVLAGGTDLMVEVNHGHRRPPAIVAVNRVAELRGWSLGSDGIVTIGAGVDLHRPARSRPGPARSRRWPPPLGPSARPRSATPARSAATWAPSSPAGDTLPVLAALDAEVELRSATGDRAGSRSSEFIVRAQAHRPRARRAHRRRAPRRRRPGHRQEYLKVGIRNAMVIAVASCARHRRAVDRRSVRVALGSVGPIRAAGARGRGVRGRQSTGIDGIRRTLAGCGARSATWSPPRPGPSTTTGRTAAYRRHAVGVLARRALRRGWRLPRRPAAWRRGGHRPVRPRITTRCGSTAATTRSNRAWLGESLLYVLRERLGLPAPRRAASRANAARARCWSTAPRVRLPGAGRQRDRHRDHHRRGARPARTTR